MRRGSLKEAAAGDLKPGGRQNLRQDIDDHAVRLPVPGQPSRRGVLKPQNSSQETSPPLGVVSAAHLRPSHWQHSWAALYPTGQRNDPMRPTCASSKGAIPFTRSKKDPPCRATGRSSRSRPAHSGRVVNSELSRNGIAASRQNQALHHSGAHATRNDASDGQKLLASAAAKPIRYNFGTTVQRSAKHLEFVLHY